MRALPPQVTCGRTCFSRPRGQMDDAAEQDGEERQRLLRRSAVFEQARGLPAIFSLRHVTTCFSLLAPGTVLPRIYPLVLLHAIWATIVVILTRYTPIDLRMEPTLLTGALMPRRAAAELADSDEQSSGLSVALGSRTGQEARTSASCRDATGSHSSSGIRER